MKKKIKTKLNKKDKMGCNCGKKKIASQPKKIVKSPSQRVVGGGNGSVTKRIIRRAR